MHEKSLENECKNKNMKDLVNIIYLNQKKRSEYLNEKLSMKTNFSTSDDIRSFRPQRIQSQQSCRNFKEKEKQSEQLSKKYLSLRNYRRHDLMAPLKETPFSIYNLNSKKLEKTEQFQKMQVKNLIPVLSTKSVKSEYFQQQDISIYQNNERSRQNSKESQRIQMKDSFKQSKPNRLYSYWLDKVHIEMEKYKETLEEKVEVLKELITVPSFSDQRKYINLRKLKKVDTIPFAKVINVNRTSLEQFKSSKEKTIRIQQSQQKISKCPNNINLVNKTQSSQSSHHHQIDLNQIFLEKFKENLQHHLHSNKDLLILIQNDLKIHEEIFLKEVYQMINQYVIATRSQKSSRVLKVSQQISLHMRYFTYYLNYYIYILLNEQLSHIKQVFENTIFQVPFLEKQNTQFIKRFTYLQRQMLDEINILEMIGDEEKIQTFGNFIGVYIIFDWFAFIFDHNFSQKSISQT